MKTTDGGPAFPSHGSMGEVTHEGMTLRDYFAAKAMTRIESRLRVDHIAEMAYEMADAMLAERAK